MKAQFKPLRFTAADCKRNLLEAGKRCLIGEGSKLMFGPIVTKEYTDKLASGKYRRPTRKEIAAELKNSMGGDFKWWLTSIEAMQGGLAALRCLAEHSESQTHDGKEEALAPHFDAIGKILDKAHRSYSTSIRTIDEA